jgi:hypothetical protein
LACAVFPLYADTLEDLLGKDLSQELLEKGELRHSFKKNESLTLFPDLPQRNGIVSAVARLMPTIGVEYLLLYEPPDETASNPMEKMYSTLLAISTLKGIEYFSASRKRMRIYFHDAYVIDSPDGKNRIDDPSEADISVSTKVYAYLHDSSMGKYTAEVVYFYSGDIVVMNITNFTTLKQFFIPIVQPGELRTYIALMHLDNKILFYGLVYVKTINFFINLEKNTESFYNRLIALYKWFKTNYQD